MSKNKKTKYILSFRKRLILTVFIANAIVFSSVLVISLFEMNKIITKNYEIIINSKIGDLNSFLDQKSKKLDLSGLDRFYSSRYKLERIRELQKLHNKNHELDPELIILTDSDDFISPWSDGSISTDFKRKIKEHNDGSFNILVENQTWRVDFKKFQPWGWTIGFAIPAEQSVSRFDSYMKNLLAVLSTMLLFSLIVIYYWLSKQTEPIRKLSQKVREFGEKKNPEAIILNINTNDEISELAHAFEGMSEKLSRYTADLEQEVQQRTKVIEEQQMLLTNSAHLSSLGEMAGSIAHEINNPLFVISGSNNILSKCLERNGIVDPLILKQVEKINLTVERITKIISGLRTISRDSSNDPMEVISLRLILDDVLPLVKERFTNHNIRMEFNPEDGHLDQKFLGRHVQIGQVLMNLLRNSFDAIEHLDESFLRLEINLDKSHLIVRIIDSGRGIEPDVLDKIFNPFFTTKAIGKGTGLGLSLSRAIIEAHDGEFYYEKGCVNTTFVLKLPIFKE